MLKTALWDRRVWLLGLTLALVVVVARWTVPAPVAFNAVIHGGYWLMLALVGLAGVATVPLVRARWAAAHFGKFDRWVLAAVLGITAVWFAHERPGYKILQDELLLLGTSMGMHYDRTAAYPLRATDVQGTFQILSEALDKRPLLFPFLVATVHDLTGYRPENPFYLNMALTVVFLWLLYLAGWGAGRTRWAGVLTLALFAGLPLMAQQSTGGGFELLNLLLIVAVALLMRAYLEAPDERGLEALVFTGLLLASTRYESAIFLLPVAVAAGWGWRRAGRMILSWRLLASPLFLLPLLAQNRLFSDQSHAWERASKPGVTAPFGLQYVPDNLGHALAFFFDFSGYLPSSSVFAAIGLAALPFFGLWIIRVLRGGGAATAGEIAWALMGLGLFAVTALYLLYFWGQFDHPVIQRLSLPVHLLMAIAAATVGAQLFCRARGWHGAILVVLGGLVLQGLPVLARQAYRTSYPPAVRMAIRGDFLAQLPDRNVLFIDNDCFFWIEHKFSASPIKQVLLRKDGLIFHLRNRSFAEMYVIQNVRIDTDTGKETIDDVDRLSPDFELETVLERRVETLNLVRISRIKAIRTDGKVMAQSVPLVSPMKERRTPEELDKARALYLESWIKNLP